MRRELAIGVALALFGASAAGMGQTQQRPNSPSPNTATPKNAKDDEAAARRTLERAGYRDITALRPNADGGWAGNATRNGLVVKVRIDSRGYIIER